MDLKLLWNSLSDLFFPRYCLMCNRVLTANERVICPECISALPLARTVYVEDNFLEERLRLKMNVTAAASLMIYEKKDRNHKLIHALKYNNAYSIGVFLGEIAGAEILDSDRFDDIDMIIPVPLHKRRMRQRGYNQSEAIARGISNVIHVPVVSDVIVRHIDNSTQTRKNTEQRWSNSSDIFRVMSPHDIAGKHLLLVDDVITSGATITSCGKELCSAEDVRLSVYALAAVL